MLNPIEVVSSNYQKEFVAECKKKVDQGYVLRECGITGSMPNFWWAIFVLRDFEVDWRRND